jgi:hypothetical protein
MKRTILAATLLSIALPTVSALAAPVVKLGETAANPLVQTVASWRYAQNCGWNNGRWVVDIGRGKIIACRPNRPGRDYAWHREGNREGWYDNRRRAWHYDKW